MCDSSDAEELVASVFDEWPDATVNLRLLKLRDESEVDFDQEANERICEGIAILNSGEQKIRYRLFTREPGDRWWVEVEAL